MHRPVSAGTLREGIIDELQQTKVKLVDTQSDESQDFGGTPGSKRSNTCVCVCVDVQLGHLKGIGDGQESNVCSKMYSYSRWSNIPKSSESTSSDSIIEFTLYWTEKIR